MFRINTHTHKAQKPRQRTVRTCSGILFSQWNVRREGSQIYQTIDVYRVGPTSSKTLSGKSHVTTVRRRSAHWTVWAALTIYHCASVSDSNVLLWENKASSDLLFSFRGSCMICTVITSMNVCTAKLHQPYLTAWQPGCTNSILQSFVPTVKSWLNWRTSQERRAVRALLVTTRTTPRA